MIGIGRLDEQPALDLSGAGPRQLGDELDRLRHLVRGEARAGVVDQLVGVEVAGGDHERGHRLSPPAILAAGDGNLGDGGMLQQGRFDAIRADVLAAADDQVVAAALHPEVPVVVEAAEIAGVKPAVAGKRRRGDRGPADEDLTVVDPDLGAGKGPAGRADARGRLTGPERADLRAGLGQAIGLDDGRTAAERLLEHLGRDGAAADQEQPGAIDGGAGIEQPDELGRDQ